MNLFEITNGIVTFAPQALVLKPFKDLWDRDKSKDKIMAVLELSFVYYFCDFKSDFIDIINENDREEEIKKILFPNKKWKSDNKILEAIDFYRTRSETVTTKLLENALSAVDKVSTYLSTVDLTDTDERGKPIHDVKKVTDTIGALDKLVESLGKIQDRVKKEREVKEKMRGNKDKKFFEDGL